MKMIAAAIEQARTFMGHPFIIETNASGNLSIEGSRRMGALGRSPLGA
jgi:hypothetical protein